MTITIQPAPDYLLHFTSKPVPGGHYNLLIESQWWGAKNRNGLQRKLDLTLTRDELLLLALTIQNAVSARPLRLDEVPA
jgi:hypothetical protein